MKNNLYINLLISLKKSKLIMFNYYLIIFAYITKHSYIDLNLIDINHYKLNNL